MHSSTALDKIVSGCRVELRYITSTRIMNDFKLMYLNYITALSLVRNVRLWALYHPTIEFPHELMEGLDAVSNFYFLLTCTIAVLSI